MDLKKDLGFVSAKTLDDVNTIITGMYKFRKMHKKTNNDDHAEIMDHLQAIDMINSMLPDLVHNNIIIKPSSRHGNGVFATKDIPKNTIVTFYPPHAVKVSELGHMILCIDSPNIKDFDTNFDNYFREYSAYSSLSESYMFVGNPHIRSNPLLLGHIINDAGGNIFKNIPINETKKYPVFKNLIKDYFYNGLKYHNCGLVSDNNNLVLCVQTKKDIRAGEELLICYEPTYWFNYTYGTNDSDGNHCITLLHKKMFDPTFDPDFIAFILNVTKCFSV